MSTERLEVETDGGQRVVADRHAGAGRLPVVLVHGLGFSRRHWRATVSTLTGAGHPVVTLDLRGFGESSLPNESYTMHALARDVDAVRRAAAIERFHLVGHSMGGMVAQHVALDHPAAVVSLVLASTTSHNGRRAGAFARAMAMLSEEGFDRATADPARRAEVEAVLGEAVPFVGPVMELLRELTLEPDRGRALAWEAIAGFSLRGQLPSIACPTLVLHGTADANIPFAAGELLAQAIAGARFVPLEGARHNLPIELAPIFDQHLVRFFEGVEG